MSALHHRRQDCRLCGSTDLTLVLELAPTPPANAFVPAAMLGQAQEVFPLDVFFCESCGHVQLLDVVDARLLFENYVYVSGTSPVFVKHFEDYCADVIARFAPSPGSLVVDIGSNDGTLLSFFQRAGYTVQGIDPARDIAKAASEAGIPTINGFFTDALALEIRDAKGHAAVITANNVFAHIDDLSGVATGVRNLLADDGVFCFEVSYLVDVAEKTLFDTIYHEHLDYHSIKPLIGFLARHDLHLIEALRVSSHGGSVRVIAQPIGGPHPVGASVAEALAAETRLGLDKAAGLKAFGRQIEERKRQLGALLRDLKSQGKTIAGFGAPAKATTLMHHFDIGPETVDFIIDDSPLKQGLYTPGKHVPVLPSAALYERKPDYVVILAWNFAESIMAKHQSFKNAGGRFIVPLPEVEVF